MSVKVPRWRRQRTLKKVDPNADWAYLGDLIWPRLHMRWWNWDNARKKVKTAEELFQGLRTETVEQAEETLQHVKEISQTAVDRAAAADRRATTIAGTVAIAASFTLGGAGILIDPSKITDLHIRRIFAVVICLITVFFVLSAIYALRALVATRSWSWVNPHDLPLASGESREKQIGMRAAHLLDGFAFNWEIADLKNRCVDRSLQFLVVALVGIGALSAILVWYSFR